jgi:6,7-dimethyl-8-ribityllumazine synthase
MKIAIVASRFNEFVTQRLLNACLDELARLKVAKKDIIVAWVPGSYEIPVTAVAFAKKKSIQAVICLGCIIRGETFHFELVARYAAQGIMDASIVTGKPVIFGVLTTDTVEQANKRAQQKGQNKGRDAAQAAVDMVNTLKKINP